MVIRHKNLSFSHYYLEEDYNGGGYMEVENSIIERFIEDNLGLNEANELQDEIDSSDSDTISIYNSDTYIILLDWMLHCCSDEEFSFDYYGESLFWILHDIAHAENDVVSSILTVNQYIEEDRIYNGIDYLIEYGYKHEFTVEMLKKINESFLTRWKHQINIEVINEKMNFDEDEIYMLLTEY